MAIEKINKIENIDCFNSFMPPIPYTMTECTGCFYDPDGKAPQFMEVNKNEKSADAD